MVGEHVNRRLKTDGVTVADFVLAYTLDWANEAHMLDGFPQLKAYLAKMYAGSHAPPRIS